MYSVPEMILFDYGQTLITEEKFDPLKGNQALLNMAVKKPEGITAEQVQELAILLGEDINEAFKVEGRNDRNLDLSATAFNRYLYEFLGVEFSAMESELEWLFWNAAAPGHPTDNIEQLLDYLYEKGIRTAVVSNMMNRSKSLKRRLDELLPRNHFEFVLASSDYMFRKPHRRIFELALSKAKLPADKIWFCGDNMICDVEGAYKAGMNPVWYPTFRDSDYKDFTTVPFMEIKDWGEIIDAIDKQTMKEYLILKLDKRDYIPGSNRLKRIAVRGIIKKGDKYVMIHSRKYGEYKFPGGGMDQGEQLEDTLLREVKEETGLTVIADTIKYFGRVEETRKGEYEDIFEMTSHYYECMVQDGIGEQKLDAYEAEYGYELEYVTLEHAIKSNMKIMDKQHTPWIDRDTSVMRWLLENHV